MRVAYLGPQGTFSEQALLSSVPAEDVRPVAVSSIYDAVMAVQSEAVELALVPIENSVEGSVTVTLDALTADAVEVIIVGELVLAVHHALIALRDVAVERIQTVLTHPQVPGQCTRLLRSELAHARVLAASSTAEAVRLVVERQDPTVAAIATSLAAEIYGAEVLREAVEDRDDNQTRFVWLARSGSGISSAPLRDGQDTNAQIKTSLVFWGAGAQRSGWLVRCLDEFARREINLSKIESRPQRERLGSYMFFLDLQGSSEDQAVADAIEGLDAFCEQVRILGSYAAV
ncbi:MAG TPA: prephenate dehydratase [Solirubrobacteraceae bacterium]